MHLVKVKNTQSTKENEEVNDIPALSNTLKEYKELEKLK